MHATRYIPGEKARIAAGLMPMIAVALVAGTILFCTAIPGAEAASRSGYQGEAEYNAWSEWQPATEVYVPFVTSNPAWGWQTTAIVQNTEPDTATITLRYYDTAGVETGALSDELPPMGSRAYPTTDVLSGSLRITATQSIVVVANDAPLDPDWAHDGLMSYRGASNSTAGTEIHLLPVYRAYQGWNSILAVQNIRDTATPITMTVYDLTGTVVFSQTDELPPHSAHLYNAATMPDLADGSIAHVRVEGANRVAGVVKNINSQTGEAVAHNNRRLEPERVRSMPPRIYLPLVLKHSLSTLVVYSLAANTSDVTATLYDGQGTVVHTGTLSLAANAATFLRLDSTEWSPPVPDGFEGSAVVEFTEPVGALVDTSWSPAPDTFSGYSGVWLDVSDTFYLPCVRKIADGLLTRITVQNAAFEASDAHVTVIYYNQAGQQVGTEQAVIKPRAAHVFDQALSDLAVPFRGSAVVTSDVGVAVVGFVGHRPTEEGEVSAESGGTLTYTDTQGLPTSIQVPAGAVSETTHLTLSPLPWPTRPLSPTWSFAGHAFGLEAYQGGVFQPGFVFSEPVTVAIHYSPADLGGKAEDSLALHTWNGSAWEDAACRPVVPHPDENWVEVPICHLSEFTLVGQGGYRIYLPLVLRH